MATFREIVYMTLDLLKEHSDDAYYTEEHILFLAQKMRAVILGKKYKGAKQSAFQPMASGNTQEICLSVEPATDLTGACSGGWLKTTQTIPALLFDDVDVYPISDVLSTNLTYIPIERMPYVGHNRWLTGIVYCARSESGYLYLHSVNRQFMFLEKVKVKGVFADPEAAASLACTESGDASCIDVLDRTVPLEDALVVPCIELIVQELLGSRYAPEDKSNDAKDNLGEANVTPSRTPKSDEGVQ